jgi:hypothetical protein
MKEHEHEEKDDFWSARHYLFTAKFPTYYTQPQKVWGRFHTSEEQYTDSRDEIIPIKEKKGKRTYVMMQPYVREPNLTLTIGLYDKPKQYVLWECFFNKRFMKHPLLTDTNMQHLWKRFELWLVKKFPKASTLATPFNDPIAKSIDEYQSFLKKLGYFPIAQAAFGKKL